MMFKIMQAEGGNYGLTEEKDRKISFQGPLPVLPLGWGLLSYALAI